ncbi:MAG: peptide-binding protein [Deltaproteobacteria bacterium]|nr:peptide-binding protein [Deltaproteobacteria bacterium]
MKLFIPILAGIAFICMPVFTVARQAASAAEATVESAPYGDVIVMGMEVSPSTLISALSTDAASHAVGSKLFTSLLKFDRDLAIVPEAAESYEVLDDGLRLRFNLRRGIRWSDGNELDLDDVEFTYRFMISPDTPTAYSGDYKQVKEFRRLGDWSFEVVYEKPFPRALMSWMMDILPRRALQGEDLRTSKQLRNPVGAGPFQLKSWDSPAMIMLKAAPDYFEGRANLDGVIYRVIRDTSTMFMELKAGKLDLMSLSNLQYVYRSVEADFASKFNVYKNLDFSYTFLGYNLRSPLFSDVRVRKAFALAIDKQDVVDGALLNQGLATIGPYRPGGWAYNTRIRDYPRDLGKAGELMAEAGWLPGEDGMLYKDGRPFVFTLLVNQGRTERIKTAVILQSQLRELGVEVKIRVVEWAAFIKEFVHTGYFDALILGWTITQDPDIYDVWHSSRAFKGGLNFIGYKNAEVDELLEKARGTFNLEARKQYYDRMQEILHDEQPYCFLYVPYSITALNKRFQGVSEAPAGIEHNFIRWWVPQNQQLYRNFLQP